MARLDQDYPHLEIRVPGFGVKTVVVTPGQSMDQTLELQQSPLSIAVEEFNGNGAWIADRLCTQLSSHPGFEVISPHILERIREEVRMHNESIASSPWFQLPIRELGVDYIVSGSVQSQGLPQ